jgi:hypothetical protein
VRLRTLSLIAPLAAAAVLTGCGAGDVIDPQKTQIALQYDVAEATGQKVESVVCPSDVPADPGNRFTCHVVATSGDEAVVEMEVTSTAGDLRALSIESVDDAQ